MEAPSATPVRANLAEMLLRLKEATPTTLFSGQKAADPDNLIRFPFLHGNFNNVSLVIYCFLVLLC